MNNDGYVKLDDIFDLNIKELKNINYEDVKNIVDSNEKKRFETNIFNNEMFIRVVQGHNKVVGSLINDDLALEKIMLSNESKYISWY